ncbi:MAG: hypothetical protein QW267_07140 [Sulfolobales archaeon]
MTALIERIKHYLGKYVGVEYCYDVEQIHNKRYRGCRKVAGVLKEVGDDYIALIKIDDEHYPYIEKERLIKLTSVISISLIKFSMGGEGFEEEFEDADEDV